MDVDSEHAYPQAFSEADASLVFGSGLNILRSVTVHDHGPSPLADSRVRSRTVMRIELVRLVPSGLEGSDVLTPGRRIDVSIEPGKDVRRQEEDGVVVDLAVIAALIAHAVEVVPAFADKQVVRDLPVRIRLPHKV